MIQLTYNAIHASVDSQGAWLVELRDGEQAILFAKTQLKAPDGAQKDRGGSHVCLPNFGPGGQSGLPQHGFGRLATWEIVRQEETTATFELQGGSPGYERLASRLSYTLSDTSLTMRLLLQNDGETALAIAPAFHPYFTLPSGVKKVAVNGKEYSTEKLAGTEFISGVDRLVAQLGERTIILESTSLPVWAIWTDQLAEYVCLEPTAAGNAFAEDEPMQLAPQERREYTLAIRW